jgi:hypothetical protein
MRVLEQALLKRASISSVVKTVFIGCKSNI